MLYRPAPSETAVRTFSISAGLAASTVTPGSTAPDVSFTTPAIPLACCAHALGARSRELANARTRALTNVVRSQNIFIRLSPIPDDMRRARFDNGFTPRFLFDAEGRQHPT